MCIMAIHPGQRTATMLQACLHNQSTVQTDLEMLAHVLAHREVSPEVLELLEHARSIVGMAYAQLADTWDAALADQVLGTEPHTHDDPVLVGAERAAVDRAAEHAAALDRREARKDETR